MRIYISYFYKVRFFRPYEVPLSTALWDPKWFHDFKGQDYVFMDRRGVLNGVRAGMFTPDDTCSSLCRGLDNCLTKDPVQCEFLQRYSAQLARFDFDSFWIKMEQLALLFQKELMLQLPVDFVLLVHEAPSNKCSERVALQQWFSDHGKCLPEWEAPNG